MKKALILITTALALILPSVGCKKASTPVTVTTTATPSGPVELKLKWPAGRRMVQSLDVQHTADISAPGMPAPMKQEMNMGQKYRLSVLKESAVGGPEVEMEFLSSRMEMKMGEKVMLDFDSTKKSPADATNPVAIAFGKLTGAKLRYSLDANSGVRKIEGIDDLRTRLASGAKNDPMGILNSMFTEEYFKQMMDHSRNMPDKPVKPGDSWPVQLEITMGDLGTMILDYTYTLQGWEKRDERYCARISFDGTLKSKPGQNRKIQGMDISFGDGKSSGETWFDLDMGMFVEGNIKQDMKMLMTMQDPRTRKSQTINNVMNQIITTKLELEK
jgi:hypothetical protein